MWFLIVKFSVISYASFNSDMIKREDDKWLAKCDLCDWSQEVIDELTDQRDLQRHMDVTHKQPRSKIKEQAKPCPSC